MRSISSSCIKTALKSASLSFAMLAMSSGMHAQTASEFQITKIAGDIVTTPQISYSGAPAKSAGTPKKWMEIETTFSWNPRNPVLKYSDDVVFNYYVLLSNKSAAYPQGTLLTGQVTHNSIPAKQNDLRTVMYLSPRILERFFDGKIPSSISSAIIDIGVTASIQGQVVAQKSLNSTSGAWWPQYQQTPGFLLNKNETPFASLNPDYYEAVKKTAP